MSTSASGAAEGALRDFRSPPTNSERIAAVRAGETAMSCDAPSPDLPPSGQPLPIRIVGWAYSRTGIDRVTVVIDDTSVPARYGLLRGDVAEALAEPEADRSGFTVLLGPDVCPPGAHRVSVVAIDRAGRSTGVTMDLLAEAPDDPPDVGRATGDDAVAIEGEAERYVPELHRGLLMEPEHQARYNWAATLAAGKEVLDAGCGVGWGTALLAGAGARRTVGLDIDEDALASGRRRAGDDAEFVRGDLLALPFANATFDLVVSFEAIEHVANPQRALDEMRRVLRTDGVLAVSSPNKGVYPAGNPFHVHELTSAELEETLRRRFRTVVMYRQQTHAGSLITDDAGHRNDDPRVAIGACLYKTWGGEVGEELYTIALASNSDLISIEGVVVLSAPLDTKHFYETIGRLKSDALLTEAKLSAAEAEMRRSALERERTRKALDEAEGRRITAERSLAGLEASVSWRITRPLRAAKRAAGARLVSRVRAHRKG